MAKRAELSKDKPLGSDVALQQIFDKVRPVLKRLGNQALDKINRAAQRYINGGNFKAAQQIAANGEKLNQFLTSLDTPGEINLAQYQTYGSPGALFQQAIKGAIQSASGAQPGSEEYQSWLNDAAKGNTLALKPVLDALREKLVSLAGRLEQN
jgi:hypothetical protein